MVTVNTPQPTPLPGEPRARRSITRWTGPGWLWLLLLGIVVVATLIAEPFLSTRNLTNVLRQMIPLGIVAVGQTLVILLAGVDLAVAATISMANTALMGIVAGQAANVPMAIGIVLGIGLLIGLINGLIIVATGVPALIVTLGTASIVTGITFLYTDQSNFGEPADVMNDIGFGSVGPVPILFFLYVLVAAVGLIVQNKTAFGTHLFAVGGSEQVARSSGIRVARVQVTAYVACGFLAALAGIAMSMRMGAGEPLSGIGFDWDSIAAVVLGGTALTGGRGGIGGTVGGVAIISILNNVMNLAGVSSFTQIVLKGVIVLIAVLLAVGVSRRVAGGVRTRLGRRSRPSEGEASA
jgi:ribose/xylose/arabinose/galactoside ABC-type transport system permease subunit